MYSRAYKAAVAIPPLVWVTGFLLIPYAILFCHSFWSVSAIQTIVHTWNLQNYAELANNPLYRTVLFRSMRIAASVTILALLLGYPLAYYLSFHATKRKELLYQLVIIPLWASYLVRGYAWKTILGNDGVLNGLLHFTHATDALLWIQNHANAHLSAANQITLVPLPFLLYSPFAVVLVLTHIYTPFVILPIYASLEHIPRNLVEASHDLGASPWSTFRKVILPLSLPGVIAGATFAFVLSLGDFLAPLLVGGSSGIMISNIVAGLFGAAYNWPLGAAIAFCMMVIVMALLFATERLEKKLKGA
jgi:spermidine/putrescine transport system permease protein